MQWKYLASIVFPELRALDTPTQSAVMLTLGYRGRSTYTAVASNIMIRRKASCTRACRSMVVLSLVGTTDTCWILLATGVTSTIRRMYWSLDTTWTVTCRCMKSLDSRRSTCLGDGRRNLADRSRRAVDECWFGGTKGGGFWCVDGHT